VGRWGFLGRGAILFTVLLTGCTPTLGASSTGWSPVVASGEVVYVATRQEQVKALVDQGLGDVRLKWTSGAGDRLSGVYQTPAVGRDLVYIGAANGNLYALDKGTGAIGETGWRRPVGRGPALKPLTGGPALDPEQQVVAIGSEDGNLYAFNAKTGDPLPWSPFRTGAKIWSTPVIRDGVIYFGSHDRHVYAVSLKDGQQLWRFRTGGAVVARPLLFRDIVVIGAFDKKLYGINTRDGSLRWQRPVEAQNWFWAGAVAGDQVIFAPSMDGNVYALDGAGNLLWKHAIGSSIVSTPVLMRRGLVVAGKNGKVSLLDPSAADLGPNRELSALILRAEVKAPLFAVGDSVFVGAQDGTVRRIEVKGTQIQKAWCFDTKTKKDDADTKTNRDDAKCD
jgi:outer membrane protein assembly factor BamB